MTFAPWGWIFVVVLAVAVFWEVKCSQRIRAYADFARGNAF